MNPEENQGLGSFLPCMRSALSYVTVVRTSVIHDNLCERKGHISLIAGKQSLTADTLSSEQWKCRQWKWLQRGRNDVWSSPHAAADHLWLASGQKRTSRKVPETIPVLREGWKIWNLYQADEYESWFDGVFFSFVLKITAHTSKSFCVIHKKCLCSRICPWWIIGNKFRKIIVT